MIYYIEDELIFPPVKLANEDGLLCFGGDLSVDRLILAYSNGIFPWADNPILWYSPDPRMIIDLQSWQPSKSLKRTFKKGHFSLTVDQHFPEVIHACSTVRDETWISQEFIDSYQELHNMGLAHSFEIHFEGELVGGLYGIALGSAFFGESMFHKKTDASKIAFYHLINFLRHHNFDLLDCQINNSHLERMGGFDVSRNEYISRLEKSLKSKTLQQSWTEAAEEYLNGN
ncbi:MAG: leucyl/phenylalanyl-tRNA--protein transferase [Lentisphaeraceae bacterium]|nr:leucyl/phenylalanyl-tRNA--protein transferase [Lentisphaeraceae bacterium]